MPVVIHRHQHSDESQEEKFHKPDGHHDHGQHKSPVGTLASASEANKTIRVTMLDSMKYEFREILDIHCGDIVRFIVTNKRKIAHEFSIGNSGGLLSITKFADRWGTVRSVDFALGDTNARANFFNENEVATIIQKNNFRLWSNRSCSVDPKWAFLSVRRTADMINKSLLRAHIWAVDRGI